MKAYLALVVMDESDALGGTLAEDMPVPTGPLPAFKRPRAPGHFHKGYCGANCFKAGLSRGPMTLSSRRGR